MNDFRQRLKLGGAQSLLKPQPNGVASQRRIGLDRMAMSG